MVCKFLHYAVYTVRPVDRAPYSLGIYVQAENIEHATLCLEDYFSRHNLSADILHIETLPHFLIATAEQYPKSSLYEQPVKPFDEALDLP